MRDRITNKPRGFGFITFTEQEAADAACSDTHTLDGRTVSLQQAPVACNRPLRTSLHDVVAFVQIDAKPSLPHGQHTSPKSKKIFVGGLPPETTEGALHAVSSKLCSQHLTYLTGQAFICAESFKQHFERFGKVTEAQIMVDHTSGRSRGFG